MEASPCAEYPLYFHWLDRDTFFASWSGLISYVANVLFFLKLIALTLTLITNKKPNKILKIFSFPNQIASVLNQKE